jgi:hypothetical protein
VSQSFFGRNTAAAESSRLTDRFRPMPSSQIPPPIQSLSRELMSKINETRTR